VAGAAYTLAEITPSGLRPSRLPVPASIETQQITVDRRSPHTIVGSTCPTGDRHGLPSCSLFELEPGGKPIPIGDTPPSNEDRMPAIDGGRIVFVRQSTQLRVLEGDKRTSRRLHGGPVRVAATYGATGVALRGSHVAYSWEWQRSDLSTRNGVFIEAIGGRRRSVVALPTKRGRVIGPVWDGGRVLFAIRRSSSSRWYSYDPTRHRFRSAPAPRTLAGFALNGDGTLFWQLANRKSFESGLCQPAKSCPIIHGRLPRLKAARRPH
jgi:hypothetical protein